MLASFWNVPFLIWNGTQDELVPVASAQAQADEFATQGLRYEWDLFTTSDHFALAINDEYGQAANCLGTTEVDRNPPRVKYVHNPTMDFATGQLVAGHAYWLSNVTLGNGGGTAPLGTIDVNSHGFGVGNPTPSAGTGAGVLTGGQAPMTYTCQSQNWGPRLPAAAASEHRRRPTTPARQLDISGDERLGRDDQRSPREAHLQRGEHHNATADQRPHGQLPGGRDPFGSDQPGRREPASRHDFTVTLTRQHRQPAGLDPLPDADGSASSGSDYDSVSGTLTFAPGETTKPISVPVHGDTTDRGRRDVHPGAHGRPVRDADVTERDWHDHERRLAGYHGQARRCCVSGSCRFQQSARAGLRRHGPRSAAPSCRPPARAPRPPHGSRPQRRTAERQSDQITYSRP